VKQIFKKILSNKIFILLLNVKLFSNNIPFNVNDFNFPPVYYKIISVQYGTSRNGLEVTDIAEIVFYLST
jgi:hypothetical protein